MKIQNALVYTNVSAQTHCTALLPGNLTNSARQSKMLRLTDFGLIGPREYSMWATLDTTNAACCILAAPHSCQF